jgi:transposase
MLSLESMIPQDHAIRVIDQFVDTMDDEKLGFVMKGKKQEGRPAYEIKSMIKLYMYGYLNSIRSSRRLAKECNRNFELWWLMQEQRPKHVTIANFRKENTKAFKELFRAFNMICMDANLFGREVVAIDGSKFRAVNSKKNNYTAKKIEQHLEYIDKKTTEYLQALEDNDKKEKKEKLTGKKVEETLATLKVRKAKYEKLKEDLAQSGEKQISTVDADARALPLHMNIVEVGYNVQTAVDERNKLIVEYEVTNEIDINALSTMAIRAKETLQIKEGEQLTVLADKGYYTGREIQKCHEAGIETLVSPRQNAHDKKDERFQKKNFVYDSAKNTYTCPEKKVLTTNGNWYNKNSGEGRQAYKIQQYKLPYHECKECPYKDECVGSLLKSSHGKMIERTEYESNLERNNAAMQANITLYKKRQAIVEHPFGIQKRQWNMTHTLLKGKEKVSGEFALIFLCYNFRRILTMLRDKTLNINAKNTFKALLATRASILHFMVKTHELNFFTKWYFAKKEIPNFKLSF